MSTQFRCILATSSRKTQGQTTWNMEAPVSGLLNFVDNLPERYKCIICHDIQDQPSLVSCCGQHFCESCLNQWSARSGQKCPHCQATGITHIVNKQQVRDINDLKVYCSNKSKGCEWVGTMVTLDKHIGVERTTETKELFPKRLKGSPHPGVTNRLAPPIASATVKPLANTCQFQEVLCPKKCKKMITRRNLSEHLKRDCLCRDYSCEHCREKGTYHTITGECGEFGPCCRHHGNSHYDRCQHYPVKCPNKCSKTIKRRDVSTHRKSCPLEPVECSFSEVGCREQLMRRDFDNHMATSDHQHLLLMMKAFKELKQETTRKQETEQLREEVSEIKARVVSLEEKSQPTQSNWEKCSSPLDYWDKSHAYAGTSVTCCFD